MSKNIIYADPKLYLCDLCLNSLYMEFTVNQIAEMLGGNVEGDGNRKIGMLGKIQTAREGEISFLSNPKYENYIYKTKATAVIVKKDFKPKEKIKPALIFVDDPYTSFTVLLEEYHKFLNYSRTGIEQPSYIGADCLVGNQIYRGAFSYIGNNARIGNNVKIYPHAYIGDDVSIGDNTVIHSGVKIYSRTQIGSNCLIHSGAVVGSDGFGFAPQTDGSYKAIPQLGNVILEDHVNIGANVTIDCATLHGDSTIVAQGSKLDNLIQVAHNARIGKNTVIAAQTGISGSSVIGDNCIIAGQVGIAGHLNIANKTSIGAKSGLSKSITKEGQKIFGAPAFELKQYLKSYAVFKKLPDLETSLQELEKKIIDLQSFQDKR